MSATPPPHDNPNLSQPQLVCAISVRDSITFLAGKIDNLAVTLNVMMRLPLSISIIAVASWFFYQKIVAEQTWLALMLVALFPFYGEAIRSLINVFTKGPGGGGKGAGSAADRAGATISALLLFGLSGWAAWGGIVGVALAGGR